MRRRLETLAIAVVTLGMTLGACGLDVVGVSSDGIVAPGTDGAVSASSSSGGVEAPRDANANASADASGDASTNVVDGSLRDAGPDAAACKAACLGDCEGDTCVIECPGPGCGSDGKSPVCPPGVACKIECRGSNACGKPSCGAAASCVINCEGNKGCAQGATCATSGSCQINCLDGSGCGGPVECQTANPGRACALNCLADNCGAYAYCCSANSCNVSGPFSLINTSACD